MNLPEAPKSEKKNRFSTIGEICYADPRLAYTLMNAGKVGLGGYIDTGGWEIINVKAQFGALKKDDPGPGVIIPVDQLVQGQLFGVVEADLWIRDVTYTVKRPRAFKGNIFKAQSDYFNSLNPNIDFTLIISSYSRYQISPDFTPLENIREKFEANAPAGLIFRFSSSVKTQLINTRVFAEDENPTLVVISFHGTRLPSDVYGQVDTKQAIESLKKWGVWPEERELGE